MKLKEKNKWNKKEGQIETEKKICEKEDKLTHWKETREKGIKFKKR